VVIWQLALIVCALIAWVGWFGACRLYLYARHLERELAAAEAELQWRRFGVKG
jgi:hypothetical protein